MSSDCTDKA